MSGSSEQLALRPFQDSDMALMERWLYAPHVAKWYKYPEHWLSELRNRHGRFAFLTQFIAEKDGVPIGFCQYYDTFFAKEHEIWNDEWSIPERQGEVFGIDLLIGEPEYLGKGFGREMGMRLLEAMQKAGVKRVVAEPEPDNAAPNRALISGGFVRDATRYFFNFED